MSDYGGIRVTTHTSPLGVDTLEIDHADDVIGISASVLTMGTHFRTDDDGNLIILGQLTYRPVRFDQDGRVIVCQRIQEAT